MVGLSELVIPILASAVVVFILSSILHMMTPWHKSDFKQLPNEAAVLDSLRSFSIAPGDYVAPYCSSPEEMKAPEFIEKQRRGPILTATVMPNGPISLGPFLFKWFLFTVVISAVAACVAGHVVHAGGSHKEVFHFTAITAFMGYAGALWPALIWYRKSIVTTIKSTVDGAIYAAATGLVVSWMWPL